MTDLTSLTIAEAKAGLASKSFTSLELTDAHLDAIEAARALNAFILETPDQARAMASNWFTMFAARWLDSAICCSELFSEPALVAPVSISRSASSACMRSPASGVFS